MNCQEATHVIEDFKAKNAGMRPTALLLTRQDFDAIIADLKRRGMLFPCGIQNDWKEPPGPFYTAFCDVPVRIDGSVSGICPECEGRGWVFAFKPKLLKSWHGFTMRTVQPEPASCPRCSARQ